jgi:hypothetical protein
VNKVIHSDAQRHLFGRLEKISLCYYGCLRTKFLDTKGWGPRRRARSLEYPFWASTERFAISTGKGLLTELVKVNMRASHWDAAIAVDWKVSAEKVVSSGCSGQTESHRSGGSCWRGRDYERPRLQASSCSQTCNVSGRADCSGCDPQTDGKDPWMDTLMLPFGAHIVA